MQITRRKALYLFLSSLLGMLLVLMFHRSAFVIFDILGDYYPASTLLNPNYYYVALADFCTMLLAMFIGGWYGIWLGLHWYKMVYEDREVRTWFHGFIPHFWRTHKVKDNPAAAAANGAPRKLIASSAPDDVFKMIRPTNIKPVWSFDDFKTVERTDKPLAKKRVVRKVAKKRVVRKIVKKTIEPEIE